MCVVTKKKMSLTEHLYSVSKKRKKQVELMRCLVYAAVKMTAPKGHYKGIDKIPTGVVVCG